MRHTRLSAALIVMAITTPATIAAGQSTYQPAPSGKQTLDQRNWLNPAQRSDLRMTFEHEWEVEPCPSPSDDAVLLGLKVRITVEWENDGRWNQGEPSDSVADPDQFILHWEGSNRWSLASANNQGSSMFGGGGSGGGASAAPFGNGTVDGIQVTVPNDVETGQDSLDMELSFRYRPDPGDDCDVKGISFMGEFIHTYEGPLSLRVKPSIRIGASGPPPKLNAGLTLSPEWFHDTYAWSKQLFDPAGSDHREYIDPPANTVPEPECCGESKETTKVDPEVESVIVTTEIDQLAAKGVVVPTLHAIQSAWIAVLTHEGYTLGWTNVDFDAPVLDPFELAVEFNDDPKLTAGGIDVLIATVDTTGYGSWSATRVAIADSIVPGFQTANVRIGDDLLALVDPDDPQAADQVAIVLDADGNIVERESFHHAISTDSGLQLAFRTELAASRVAEDGVLQLRHGDWVELVPGSDDGIGSGSKCFAMKELRADTIDPNAAESTEADGISFHGTTMGGMLVLDFFGDGQPWSTDVPSGLGGVEFEVLLMERLIDAGLDVAEERLSPRGIRFGGSATRLGLIAMDGGLGLRTATGYVAVSPADLDGDGLVNGNDFGILLAHFGSQGIGIPGDINEDGIVDGTDFGLMIADWT